MDEAGWKRQVVVRDLKSGVEEDATAYVHGSIDLVSVPTIALSQNISKRDAP